MDPLTHLFAPLTAACARSSAFCRRPATAALAGFAAVPDADKLLGRPGLLHSLLTLAPLVAVVYAVERSLRGTWTLAATVAAFLASHLVLDFVDGGPVPLLYPLVEAGPGLQYPSRIAFDAGFGVAVEGPLLSLRVIAPRAGFHTYPTLITGTGVLSVLVFVAVAALRPRDAGGAASGTDEPFDPVREGRR